MVPATIRKNVVVAVVTRQIRALMVCAASTVCSNYTFISVT
jgi:hypothetical protein